SVENRLSQARNDASEEARRIEQFFEIYRLQSAVGSDTQRGIKIGFGYVGQLERIAKSHFCSNHIGSVVENFDSNSLGCVDSQLLRLKCRTLDSGRKHSYQDAKRIFLIFDIVFYIKQKSLCTYPLSFGLLYSYFSNSSRFFQSSVGI